MDPALERQILRAYEVFVTGDIDRILGEFVPDATFTNPPYAIEGGVRHGLEEMRGSFQALHDEFEFRGAEVEQIVEGPEGVLAVVQMDARGRISGAPFDGRFFHAFKLRDGLVCDFAWFSTLAEGRQAIGLDP
jgi:ketosteroid isomerase-like protein